ncbi:diacylglycerol O-acyltransferase 1 [Dipsacomyces acuminosporus]|nr:diacylglycerol O-acyltransferase 1 [Dipsacomyces acuminosporus]
MAVAQSCEDYASSSSSSNPKTNPAATNGDAKQQQPSRSYFEPPFLNGIRVPTGGLAEEWEAYFGRVFEFLQETKTTAMVTIWTTAPLLSLLLFVYLFQFQSVRPLLAVYLVFCFFDPRPYDGVGRRYSIIQKLPIWDHINKYFQPKLVFEEQLDPAKRYVFGCHPHGVISYMSQIIAGPTGLGIESHFPGLVVRGVTMPAAFFVPFFRDYALAMGCLSCDRNSIRRILSDRHHKLHQSLLVVVGGAEESMLAHDDSADLVLLKRRGFVREAIRAGCDLVPIYNFNENSIYKLVPNDPGTFAHRFEMAIKNMCGFTILLFHGQNICYTPYRTQLTSVAGRPIPTRRNYDPSDEEIEHYHSLYVAELTRIYNKYRHRYAPSARDIRFVA